MGHNRLERWLYFCDTLCVTIFTGNLKSDKSWNLNLFFIVKGDLYEQYQ